MFQSWLCVEANLSIVLLLNLKVLVFFCGVLLKYFVDLKQKPLQSAPKVERRTLIAKTFNKLLHTANKLICFECPERP